MKRNKKGLTLTLSVLSLLCTTCIGAGVVAVAGGFAPTGGRQAQQAEEVKPFAEQVRVGDVIAVPELDTIEWNAVTIISPSGKVYSGTKFTVDEAGKYTVEYLQDGKTVYTLSCNAIRSAADLVLTNAMASVDGIRDYAYNNDPAYRGVAVDIQSGASISFDQEINMSRFSKYDLLFEATIEPNKKGDADFETMVLTFTDVEDENSYFTVNLVDGHVDGGTAKYVGFVNTAAVGQTAGGYSYNNTNNIVWQFKDIYGTDVVASFRAETYNGENGDAEPFSEYSFKLYYDYEENALYTYRWMQKALVADFDDPVVYGGSVWSGFKSGRAKLSVSFKNVTPDGGTVIFNNVGGIRMTQEEIIDVEAPELTVDLRGETKAPNVLLGKDYEIFPYDAYDFYDANVKVDVFVTYKDLFTGAVTNVPVQDMKFKAEKLGEYTIFYQATDFSGNTTSQQYSLLCVAEEEAIEITGLPRNMQATVFEPVTIPSLEEVQFSGGFGHLKTSVKAINPKGDEFELANWTFTPDMLGEYQFYYKAEDFYGTYKMKSLSVIVEETSEVVILNEIVLPELLISKFTYTIPEIIAKACKDGKIVDCQVEYFINGDNKLGDDRTFTIEAGATEVYIECRAYLEGTEKSKTISVTKKVVDGLQGANRTAYFYTQNGNVEITENRFDITMTTTKDSLVQFANKLNGENFLLGITFDATKTKFSSFDVTLNDVAVGGVSITLSFKFSESGVTVTTPFGEPVKVDNVKGYFIINLDCNSGRLLDGNSKALAVLNKYDSGVAFAGFEDGVYMQMSFKGVEAESSLTFNKLNNQGLGYLEKKEENRGDKEGPELQMAGELALSTNVGETITVYGCRAYDVYNQVDKTVVSVQSPSGEMIVPEKDATESFDLKLTEKGEYIVYYESFDSLGNSTLESYSISVINDVPPALKISGSDMVKSVGDTVKLPKVTVSDDLGEVNYDIFLTLPTGEIRLLVHFEDGKKTSYLSKKDDTYPNSFKVSDSSFKLEMTGKYVVTVMAYDNDLNMTMKSYTITVR